MKPSVVLVTGATSGIGRHAALHLARAGHRVIASGRNEAALATLRAEAQGAKGTLDVLRLDVTDAASIAAAVIEVDRLTDGHGLDVLVNNAGYGIAGPLVESSLDDVRAMYETNVFGLLAVTRAFAPKMMARRAGRVINVGSIGGRITFPFMGAYNSTKYAVESLSDALRVELAPFDVEVALIEPGPVRSEFAERAMGSVATLASASSPYAAVYERAAELRAQSDAQAVGPEETSGAIEHAIVSRRPRARYVVPLRAMLVIAALKLLPTRWGDWLLGRFTGLTRRALRAAPELAAAR